MQLYGNLLRLVRTKKEVFEKIIATGKHLMERVNLPFIKDVDMKDIEEKKD